MFKYLQNNTAVKIFNFEEGLLISSPTCHFYRISAFSHCDSVFRSCMVEESGTLESQLEATKVSNAHLLLKYLSRLMTWEHGVGMEMHAIVWQNLN